MKKLFAILCIVLVFTSCKNTATTTCQPQNFNIIPILKPFEFKQGSYWVYTSSSSTQIDSMKVVSQSSGWDKQPNTLSSHSPPNDPLITTWCYQYEIFSVGITHRSFDGGVWFGYHINYNYIFLRDGYYDLSGPLGLTTSNNNNAGNGGTLEKTLDTLTVNGVLFHTVYQMYYPMAWMNFQRVWWCANIGFVKFEYINKQNQTETWALNNYHVVF